MEALSNWAERVVKGGNAYEEIVKLVREHESREYEPPKLAGLTVESNRAGELARSLFRAVVAKAAADPKQRYDCHERMQLPKPGPLAEGLRMVLDQSGWLCNIAESTTKDERPRVVTDLNAHMGHARMALDIAQAAHGFQGDLGYTAYRAFERDEGIAEIAFALLQVSRVCPATLDGPMEIKLELDNSVTLMSDELLELMLHCDFDENSVYETHAALMADTDVFLCQAQQGGELSTQRRMAMQLSVAAHYDRPAIVVTPEPYHIWLTNDGEIETVFSMSDMVPLAQLRYISGMRPFSAAPLLLVPCVPGNSGRFDVTEERARLTKVADEHVAEMEKTAEGLRNFGYVQLEYDPS